MSLLTILGVASMLFVVWFTWWNYANNTQTSGQSRLASVVEAWVNIGIGFGINFVANILIIPLATEGHGVTAINNWWMGWVFTTISMLRQVAIRRWFNERIHLFAARTAKRLT